MFNALPLTLTYRKGLSVVGTLMCWTSVSELTSLKESETASRVPLDGTEAEPDINIRTRSSTFARSAVQ